VGAREQMLRRLAEERATVAEDRLRHPSLGIWLQQGIDNGYCSEPFCATHIAPPGYDHDGDGDECIPSVRVYPAPPGDAISRLAQILDPDG